MLQCEKVRLDHQVRKALQKKPHIICILDLAMCPKNLMQATALLVPLQRLFGVF